MQSSHLLGASAVLAGLLALAARDRADAVPTAPPGDSTIAAVLPPQANGHYVLVVEGDCTQLGITAASRKQDPWAGVPKGFRSDWRLAIHDAAGRQLASVPLDVSKFDLDPARLGEPRRVQGCIVRDSRVAMLANVPCFAEAASYTFARGDTVVGTVAGTTVQQLAGVGR